MAKLTDKQKKKIIADYVENQNYRETARINEVSVDTVRRLVLNDDEVVKTLTQKKQENTQSTIEYMQNQHESKKRILDKILKAIEEKADNVDMFTNIKDLATAYGIILDKELKVLELNSKNSNSDELAKVDEILKELKENAIK